MIGATKATTAAGISAKARILPMVINDDSAGEPIRFPSIETVSVLFFQSFAADVKAYMDTVISTEHKAAHEASKGGAA